MSESLRDTIADAFETVTAKEVADNPQGVVESSIPGPGNEPEKVPEKSPTETQEKLQEKPGRTAGRQRDETGKLLPGKAVKVEAVETPVVQRPPRPSSWKKDYWEHWDKLDPKLAEYLNQRESEFAKGVSTYKQEWDQVRPIAEVMAEFQPILQQNNIKPEVWIRSLGNAHKILATGQPQEKLSAAMKLFQDYQIPIEQLFVQGNDGKLYFNPQVQPFQQTQQQPQQPPVEEVVKKILLEQSTAQEISNFATATDDKGQLKHPHFETVKKTMQGLLQAELATDIADAYNKAILHHPDIAASIREQETKAELERKAKEQAEAVARARKNVISPKGSTPAVPDGAKPKGVRAALSDAFDQVVGGGRV